MKFNTDAELVSALLSGEQQAFEVLVKRYHGPLRSMAASIIGAGQAEECVQETLLAAIRQLPHFEARSSLKTWLFTIVSNQAKSRLRKQKREIYLEDITDGGSFADALFKPDGHWAQAPTAWHDNSPEALLSHDDFMECLDKTIDDLPELQKMVINLREYQGFELEEVCNILDITASNVRVLIHRARARVYAMINHYEETGSC